MSRSAQPADNNVYVPDHGDPSYDVTHYELSLTCSLESNQLGGRARLLARAVADLTKVRLDLAGLRVTKVRVDGATVGKFVQRGRHLHIKLAKPLSTGSEFEIDITYSGSPRPLSGLDGDAGWEELADGVIVASQPHGAPSWFPCNDRPDNKASYRFEITAPQGYSVIANGVPGPTRRRSSSVTWVYEETAPMATYLATVQIGRYVLVDDRAGHDDAVPVRSWCPPARRAAVEKAFSDQGAMLAYFERIFGPYPFDGYTAVITDDELEIPLEAQGLSIFGSNLVHRQWSAQRLIAHELAHQWFGNSVTLSQWRDIWLHEGFACYAEWLWSQESGSLTTEEHARAHHRRLSGLAQDVLLGDPGPDLMFDDRIYKRGALTLHALRAQLGDDAFFALLQRWSGDNKYASVSTEQFAQLVTEVGGPDASALLDRWVRQTALPDLPQPTTASGQR